MPTYQPNIPQASNLISISQNDILENFQQLNTAWNVDHSAFNLASQGQHTKVTLTAPIANPNKATPIASLYTKAAPTTILSDLYYQNNSTSNDVVQLTGGGITSAAWCYFNGATGALITGYNVTSTSRTALGSYTINFTRSFSSTNYAAIISPNMAGNGGFAIKLVNAAPNTTNYSFGIQNQTNAFSDATVVSAVFFGVLS